MAEASARTVRAAGGVVWRRADGEVQVAVVHRPKYDDWSLPKGKLDRGEPAVVGAVREVEEETGFRALPGRSLGESRYRVLDRGRDVPKTVRWWSMRCATGAFVPGQEVDDLRWLAVPAALELAGSAFDTGPLHAFAAQPPESTTVLLVGAAAPPRATARIAAAYGMRCVVAAGAGARQSARRLADLLGVQVDDADDPVDALVRKLAVGPSTLVWTTEDAVEQTVTGQAHAAGAVWALTFAGGRLVDTVDAARLED